MTPDSADCAVRQAHIRFGLVYWGGAFLASAVFYAIRAAGSADLGDHAAYLAAKFLRYGSGWLITSAMSYLLFRLHRRAVRRGPAEGALPLFILGAFALSLAAAPLWPLAGVLAQTIHPVPNLAAPDRNSFVTEAALGAALFFGWSCLFISLLFSFDLHDRGQRLAAARQEALSAQMRALRYQVNPHFLFNTLNSIAGLIEEGAADRAERMVLGLSGFLRSTLSLDPMQDVPLSAELALQQDYLCIERERFSDRMQVSIDLPPALQQALVPSLILQPLIENAVKHGVSPTIGRVEITLRARSQEGRLLITIENDMPLASGASAPPGMGLGLRNIAERLAARFGSAAELTAGPAAPGRFRASLGLPLRFAPPA